MSRFAFLRPTLLSVMLFAFVLPAVAQSPLQATTPPDGSVEKQRLEVDKTQPMSGRTDDGMSDSERRLVIEMCEYWGFPTTRDLDDVDDLYELYDIHSLSEAPSMPFFYWPNARH